MNSFFVAFNAVMPMTFLAVSGYLLKKNGYFSKDTINALNKICFDVFLPVLTFNNISKSDIHTVFDIKLILYAVFCIVTTIFICILSIPFIEKDKGKQGSLIQGIYRSNFVILGLPLAAHLGGDVAQEITSMLLMIIIPMYNFFAVIILSVYGGNSVDKKKLVVNILKNNMIIGSIIGIIVSLLGIRFSSPIQKTIDNFSVLGGILPMVVLGASLDLSRVTTNKPKLIAGVVSKLIIVPLVFLSLATFIGYRNEKIISLIAMLTSPTAVSSAVMAGQMGCNYELSTQLVVFSTVFSCITVFFWIFTFDFLQII